ncbi:HD domain-containing protein [Streptococcus sp.]|uniref:HD domain-containing protein n=1 Tax=Streptococcus sp. TaxID=1306 RepID=UPI00391C6871
MKEEKILQEVATYVERKLSGEGSGHDWWHIVRVRKLAEKLALAEGGDSFICQLAALVHDLVDDKLVADEGLALAEVRDLLTRVGVAANQTDQVLTIIQSISYKGGNQNHLVLSLEGQIVQDADRLDAMGAIGVARTMAYSGHHQRIIHDPEVAVRQNMTLDQYRSHQGTAITHFYEKLLLLKDLMNTKTAQELAKGRHAFLEAYLDQFFAEWDGQC